MWTAIKTALGAGLSFLSPVLGVLQTAWSWVCAAAAWCVRQAAAAPAWTAVLVGVVVAAWWLSGERGYSRGHAQGYTDGKAIVMVDLRLCQTNEGKLGSALQVQNAQIAALGKQGAAQRAAAAAAVAQAQAEAQALRKRLAALLASPPAGKNECERAISARRQIEEDMAR